MIEIKVYRLMDDLRIEVALYASGGEVTTRANWQGRIDEDDVLSELSHHLANALSAVDRLDGSVHEQLLFGT